MPAIWLVVAVVALLVAAPIVVVLGLRTGNPTVFRVLRTLQRDVLNPRQLRTAGSPDAPWGVVRHVGRVSGWHYETPVGVARTPTGFVIALPYDLRPDWVRNVLAAGTAEIVTEGRTHRVSDVRVVPIGDTVLAEKLRVISTVFGITRALACRADDPEGI